MSNIENQLGGAPGQDAQETQVGISKSLSDMFENGEQNQALVTDTPEVQETTEAAVDTPVDNAPETPTEASVEPSQGSDDSEDLIEIGDVKKPSKEGLEIIEEDAEPAKFETPEGLEELAAHINSGGTLQSYLELNKDYSDYSDDDILSEYLKSTNDDYDDEDIQDILEEYSFDEEVDEAKEIRSKKRAKKEQLKLAKEYLEQKKGKYKELKGSERTAAKKTPQDLALEKAYDQFVGDTNDFFGDKFDGFRFDISMGEGDDAKKVGVKYVVDNKDTVKDFQMNFNNLLGEFAGEDGSLQNIAGYHKALFAAKNVDQIAQMFFDQGFAMAVADAEKESKNIDFKAQKHDPSSNSKLKPGQAREIQMDQGNNSQGRVQLSPDFFNK